MNFMQQSLKPAALCLSLLLTLGLAGAARAAVSVYIVAPGDTLWSIANENLHSPHDWKRLMEFNGLGNEAQLKVDQVLRIPSEWLKTSPEPAAASAPPPADLPPPAMMPAGAIPAAASPPRRGAEAVADVTALSRSAHAVAATYGRVELIKGAQRSTLAVDDTVTDGSRIATGATSSVNLLLRDGTMLVLLSDTEVVLGQPLELRRGVVELSVDDGREWTRLSSAAGTVSAQQARFRAAAADDGRRLRVEVQQGTVTLANGAQQRNVSAGLALQLDAGKPIPEPRQGLLRPDLTNLAKQGVNGEIRLSWPAIAEAAAYRAQLVYARETYLVLHDQTLQAPQLEWRNISPGRYIVRLRSVDQNGLEGLDAELSFNVMAALEAPRSNTPQHGATLPTDRPWVGWSRVPEANAYILQVARDAQFKTGLEEFTHLVNNYYRYDQALPPGDYYWRVKSVARDRVQSPFGETRMFIIKP